MTPAPQLLSVEVVTYIFNLGHGQLINRRCRGCKQVTEQAVISYADMSGDERDYVKQAVGRVLDIVPGARLLLGRPTVCKCGNVNQ
jgi:hypothetical protein